MTEKDHLLDSRECEIAALFHDIGKLRQHSFNGKPEKKHAEYSGELLDKLNLPQGFDSGRIRNMALKHHDKGEPIRGIMAVKKGDWYSAAMDREKDEESEPNRELQCIFSSVILEDHPFKESAKLTDHYYAAKPIDVADKNSLFPTKTTDKSTLINDSKSLWNKLEAELQKIPAEMDYYNWMTTVLDILKRYTLNVVSAGYFTRPNVSLYNHLTTTAAIARSMRQYDLEHGETGQLDHETPRHLLIKGDLNGIQKFIFEVKTPEFARKRMSKRLRGRSFFIQLISEAILHTLLRRMELSETAIIVKAAGTFTLLVPNTETNITVLKEERKRIKDFLRKEFPGTLSLSIAWISVSNTDLKSFKELESKMNSALTRARFDPLDCSDDQAGFFNHFRPYGVTDSHEVCSGCILASDRLTENFCANCEMHTELGGDLPKIEGILRTRQKLKITKNKPISILGVNFYLLKSTEGLTEAPGDTAFLYMDKRAEQILQEGYGLTELGFRLSIPNDFNGNPISFDNFVHIAAGMDRLAIFKADVDNLGAIFATSTFAHDAERSLAKVKDISMRLDLFFSSYVPILAQKLKYSYIEEPCSTHMDKFRQVTLKDELGKIYVLNNILDEFSCKKCEAKKSSTIYSIFSGGDDLAYVGPWNVLVHFALEVYKEFRSYVANNPFITLSGAIHLFRSKEPLALHIQKAEHMLERSKSYLKYKKASLKNAVTLFDETVFWAQATEMPWIKAHYPETLESLLNFGNNVIQTLQDQTSETKRSFLHNLLLLREEENTLLGAIEQEELELSGFKTSKIHQPLLAYHLHRRFKNKQRTLEEFNKWTAIFHWLRLPLSWAIYSTKSGGKN